MIKNKELKFNNNILGKKAKLNSKYIKWLHKNVFNSPSWFSKDWEGERERDLFLNVCNQKLEGVIQRINHRGCREDELNVQIKFSNNYTTIVRISDLNFK